jgi:hypothetical protein
MFESINLFNVKAEEVDKRRTLLNSNAGGVIIVPAVVGGIFTKELDSSESSFCTVHLLSISLRLLVGKLIKL